MTDNGREDVSREPSDMSPCLKIAIVGGGLVGAFSAIALSKLDNVKVSIYERNHKASEVGAWIAITNSSFEVLRNFIDLDELNKIVYRGDQVKTYVTRYWKTGEVLAVQKSPPFEEQCVEARTHRVPVHNLLLKNVPPDIIKYSHKLQRTQISGEKVHLTFDNGKEEEADLVLAADGIYSKIRLQYYPESKTSYKGRIAYRKVFPSSLLNDVKGLHNDTSVWSKGGELVFMSRVGLEQYGIVIIIPGPAEFLDRLSWNKSTGEWGIKYLKSYLKDWDPTILEVLDRIPAPNAFPLETAPWLDNLSIDNKIVFLGDSAHPTSGVYGAGSAFGFCDAWALYRALQETSSNYWTECTSNGNKYNLALALRLYNDTRVPFLKRVEKQMTIDASVTKNYLKKSDSDKQDRARLKLMSHGFDWLRTHSVELQFQQVRDEHLELLHRNLESFMATGEGISPF